jgi:lipoyl(octanoyl) transferase
MTREIIFQDLGLIDYQMAWDYQVQLFKQLVLHKNKSQNQSPPSHYLLFCEHPPVYTLGKNGNLNNLLIPDNQRLSEKIDFYQIDRGGDITFHGLGQLVVYPILDLEKLKIGLRQYIFNLEEIIIQLLQTYNLESGRINGASGVWLAEKRKICAIGVKSSRYVTMHGLAFNINTDLKYFSYINPCGFIDKKVTSLAQELGKAQDFELIKQKFKVIFQAIFEVVGTEKAEKILNF